MVKKGPSLMDKSWLKSWPQGVPHRLDLPERPLHAFLKDHAHQSPDRPAIQYYGRRISFGELDGPRPRWNLLQIAMNRNDGYLPHKPLRTDLIITPPEGLSPRLNACC